MRYLVLLLSLFMTTGALAGTFHPTEGRTVAVVGAIDSSALSMSDDIMKLADGSGKPIDLVIQSPGGRIDVGRTIIQAMKIAQVRGHVVRCVVVSYAASMAFSILANCSERYALAEAQMLYHPPRIGLMMATVTPQMAAQLHAELKKISLEIIRELQALYPVPLKPFLRHYLRESWHSAADLNAALGGNQQWITQVDDVSGIKSVVSDNPQDFEPAVPGQIIYQYLPK